MIQFASTTLFLLFLLLSHIQFLSPLRAPKAHPPSQDISTMLTVSTRYLPQLSGYAIRGICFRPFSSILSQKPISPSPHFLSVTPHDKRLLAGEQKIQFTSSLTLSLVFETFSPSWWSASALNNIDTFLLLVFMSLFLLFSLTATYQSGSEFSNGTTFNYCNYCSE